MKVLAIGDVCGPPGVEFLEKKLALLKRETYADLVIVNAENANMRGIMPRQADAIFSAGADVITLGNHTYHNSKIFDYLDDNDYIIRPLNMPPQRPGKGYTRIECCGKIVCVINLIGRVDMDFNANSPFIEADRVLNEIKADIYIFDFHAQATSEKKAMGYHLAGRVSAVYGTHTHVPTADEQVLPGGTGYITDIGMTGGIASVIGVKYKQSLEFFKGNLTDYFESSEEDVRTQGALFEIDDQSKCLSVTRIDYK